jgi:tetratricopeptide (TPR) repeat protein
MTSIAESLDLALQQFNSGQLERADTQCRLVLQIDSGQSDALHLRGLIAYRSGKPEIAVRFIIKAIEHNPRAALYFYHLGIILVASGELGKAIESYREAISLKPNYAEALNNLGLILYDLDEVEESIVLFQQAIRCKPNFSNAHYNLGNSLQALGNPTAAISAYDQALKIVPNSPETHFNRSLSLLLAENFEEGWVEYEWRFGNLKNQIKILNGKDIHRWDGSSFVGKRLLVFDEQGLGDTLQFIRYLPMVKELGGTVAFETIPPLIKLLGDFQGVDELLDRLSIVRSDLTFDQYIPLMSLPGIFNTNLETIPDRVPYIYPDRAKSQYWRNRLSEGEIKVGIVWAGKTSAEYRQNRKSGLEHVHLGWAGQPASNYASHRLTRLESFMQLSGIAGVHLYGLQKGEAALQASELSELFDIDNLGEEFNDFSDTAAAIANLDLVISVDTSVAHLAGAMGKPVWVLLPFIPDWRWMLVREDSPWYPSMRLFRQTQKGDWEEVFQRITSELHTLVQQ